MRRSSLFWGIVIVLAGVLLLLQQLNLLLQCFDPVPIEHHRKPLQHLIASGRRRHRSVGKVQLSNLALRHPFPPASQITPKRIIPTNFCKALAVAGEVDGDASASPDGGGGGKQERNSRLPVEIHATPSASLAKGSLSTSPATAGEEAQLSIPVIIVIVGSRTAVVIVVAVWRRGDHLPVDVAIFDVRVVTAGMAAVVPVVAVIGRVFVVGIIVGNVQRIRIDRLRVEVPDAAGEPPPAVAVVMTAVVPVSVFPEIAVMRIEAVHVAVGEPVHVVLMHACVARRAAVPGPHIAIITAMIAIELA